MADLIPGLFYTRLHHDDLKIRDAITARLQTDSSYSYKITYPEADRSLVIHYEKTFPFKILGWHETWRENGKVFETSATLQQTLYTDYWHKNASAFQYLRDSLKLPNPY